MLDFDLFLVLFVVIPLYIMPKEGNRAVVRIE